ncbi:hypothetical protein AQI88_07275 [Streptomyces cellostaticus]|uniref:Uncharacterized protein n=2 Tax=Streptomyces cellostaticus TaxID=67285 RepID=A0A101NQW5_9ACTN|nr:hypothetical protein AQI88_07275 [Streptomyces cellostaticus]GHI07992.1 hypothetical protein Scel_63130 [Streptomyces cellostaticus]
MIPGMADYGGGADSSGPIRRSRLAEYVELADTDVSGEIPAPGQGTPFAPTTPSPATTSAPSEADDITCRRREFVAEAGLPRGVLVDACDGERGLVLPPVLGIVPEAVAVDGPDGAGGAGEAEPEHV